MEEKIEEHKDLDDKWKGLTLSLLQDIFHVLIHRSFIFSNYQFQ